VINAYLISGVLLANHVGVMMLELIIVMILEVEMEDVFVTLDLKE